MTAYSETRRQILHVSMAGFALLLRYLTWPQAAALALLALGFNMFALAAVVPGVIRETDRRGVRAGVLYYPLSVLVLVLAFPHRLDIVAAAWGVMAFGDGFATLVGTTIGGKRLPWNPQKTWSGLVAFMLAGSAGAVALSIWVAPAVTPSPTWMFTVLGPVAAAVAAAFVETLPVELDDNISVPASAACLLWFASQTQGLDEHWREAILAGMAVSLPIALIAWKVHAVTMGGAVVGFIFATIIFAAFGAQAIATLGIALLLTALSSLVGRRRKAFLHIEEDRHGRGAGNVIANCLVGTAGAALALLNDEWALSTLGPLMFVAGIAAGASDTVASEIGKAWGGQPRAFPTFEVVSPGTPGAVSPLGTLAGMIAAAIIAAPMLQWFESWWTYLGTIVLVCTCGAFVESALATRFERHRVLDNNTLNLLNTAAAAGLALLLLGDNLYRRPLWPTW